MTEDEFVALFNECGSEVADRFYPKNDTAAFGGAPSASWRVPAGSWCSSRRSDSTAEGRWYIHRIETTRG